MEDSIKELTTSIDNKCKEIIKDNKLLINGFKVRLIKRLLGIFNRYGIPFSKEVLESTITDYLINILRDSTIEVCSSYRRVLYKYFDTVNEYYNSYRNSKERIKNATSIFIKRIFSEKNPILNETISDDFISTLKLKVLVYDNYNLNKELEDKIKSDTDEVINEINHNNKDYMVESVKEILMYILGK